MDKFGMLGKERKMHSYETISQKTGDTGRAMFQYRQVRDLEFLLMKNSYVFRPLT